MKNLNNYINENKEIHYRIALSDCSDKDGMPISVTVLVDSKYQDCFEKYLEKEKENSFMHAEGGNIEY